MDERHSDRITVETRIIGAAVIVVLLLAFLALYLEPQHTDQNFAWTVTPLTSPILMGAGYTAGAYFFARVVTEKKWHRVQAGFLAITAFTICMLAATILHWDRFHHGQPVFYLWFIIYLLTPFVVPFLWWRNRATASEELEAGDLRFSRMTRWVLSAGASLGILIFIVVFIAPTILISLAPWKLTPLTARVFAGWTILTLASVVNIALDGRWSATRYLMQAAMVGLVLSLLALPRIWPELNPANPLTYALVGGMVVTLAAFIAIHLWLDAAVRRKLQPEKAAGSA